MEFPVAHLPVRSISLPPRVHPSSVKIESILKHLKTSLQLCSGSETIQHSLACVTELYTCVEDLILSPQTRQALLRSQGGRVVEEALQGSVTLLDTCSTSRDIVSTMKEQVQILQSALRRRSCGGSSIKTSIQAYMSFRKKARKEITKCLEALKKMETKCASPMLINQDNHLSAIVMILREANSVTVATFRSILLFLSTPAVRTKAGGWSLITKLLSSEKGKKIMNEMGSVDVALQSIVENLRKDEVKEEVQVGQRMLEALSVSIEGLEAGLDTNFRCLVKNRVSFLNILAQ